MQQDQDARRVETGAGSVRDVRAAARASLAAGRSPSLWWTCAGIVVSVALVVTSGAPDGALALAAMMAAAGIARALMPDPGPVAFAVRSRPLDVTMLLVLAVGIGVLSQIIPTR